MSERLRKLIAEGEHQRLDFKYEVSDFRKIARTLVSFSNTDGGRLLIGVKDNGAIAGVRSEEEYFMLDGAARIYCRPEVVFRISEWNVDGKRVLEAVIGPGRDKPYLVHDTDGVWRAYIRQGDENFRADPAQVEVWRRIRAGQSAVIRYREAERELLGYLERRGRITRSRFRQIGGVSPERAEEVLIAFLLLGILRIEYSDGETVFTLSEGYGEILEGSET
jgi:predicted HTH transcriptional regulator